MRKEEYTLSFDSNCDYDEAINYFNKRRSELKNIKKVLGEPKVYKENESWIIKQDVVFSLFFRLKIFLLGS